MTSVIFNDPSGSDFLYKFSGVQLNAPSGETLALGANAKTADNSNAIVTVGESYIRIPQGVSNERPTIPNSYVGMMRYLTTENLLEYFNGQTNTWLPISLPSPTISSISPNYISFNQSGPETNSNTYTLTGSNFNIEPGGISVEAIGNNGTGTILIPNFNNASSETSATFTFDPSGTEQLIGISNELPFAVKLTNTNSGFSSTLNNAIIATNAGPEFTQPNVFTPFSFETFAVQDPCANFIVSGIDLSQTKHYPLDFSFVSGTAGGFNVAGGDISSISDFSSIVQVPAGNRLSATAGSYNFTMRVTDASNAFSDANYTLSLANPTITSIDPSYIYDTSVVDINITGNYFIRDTDISFSKGSNTLTQSEVSYNNINSLTVKDVSAGEIGVYDISLANGSVIVNVPSVVLNIVRLVQFTTSSLTTEIKYFDEGGSEIPSPTFYGETLIYIKGSSGGSITFPNIISSISCEALIVGGGGPGGFGHGGGGAGGAVLYRTDQSIINNTYSVTIGQGGTATSNAANNAGGSSSMFGVTATGGGAGANEVSDDTSGRVGDGGNGANGGGGCYTKAGGVGTAPTASGWTVYGGNNGGAGASTSAVPYGCGGGGGAGGAGESSSTIGNQGGDGANGIQINIDGNNYYWGAGGGGVTYSAEPGPTGISGNGGLGGGGGGCSVSGTPGTGGGSALNSGGNGTNAANSTGGAGGANTGSGGGGGANENGVGGPGGSGIVIIRFPSYILTIP
jgi:hypothetical protein